MKKKDDERKKKKEQDWFEAYVITFMTKCINTAARAALDDLFKNWH